MQGFPLAGKRADSDNLVSVATDLTSSANSQIQFVWSRAYDKNKPGCGQKTLRWPNSEDQSRLRMATATSEKSSQQNEKLSPAEFQQLQDLAACQYLIFQS